MTVITTGHRCWQTHHSSYEKTQHTASNREQSLLWQEYHTRSEPSSSRLLSHKCESIKSILDRTGALWFLRSEAIVGKTYMKHIIKQWILQSEQIICKTDLKVNSVVYCVFQKAYIQTTAISLQLWHSAVKGRAIFPIVDGIHRQLLH